MSEIATVGLDLARNVFQVHGSDDAAQKAEAGSGSGFLRADANLRRCHGNLRCTLHYGLLLLKRWNGYQARKRIETGTRSLKGCAERISVKQPDNQTAKIQICVAFGNRFNDLGTAEIIRLI